MLISENWEREVRERPKSAPQKWSAKRMEVQKKNKIWGDTPKTGYQKRVVFQALISPKFGEIRSPKRIPKMGHQKRVGFQILTSQSLGDQTNHTPKEAIKNKGGQTLSSQKLGGDRAPEKHTPKLGFKKEWCSK